MKKDSPGFDYVYCKNGKENHIAMDNPGENIIPLNPQDISISKKLEALFKENTWSRFITECFHKIICNRE